MKCTYNLWKFICLQSFIKQRATAKLESLFSFELLEDTHCQTSDLVNIHQGQGRWK